MNMGRMTPTRAAITIPIHAAITTPIHATPITATLTTRTIVNITRMVAQTALR